MTYVLELRRTHMNTNGSMITITVFPTNVHLIWDIPVRKNAETYFVQFRILYEYVKVILSRVTVLLCVFL